LFFTRDYNTGSLSPGWWIAGEHDLLVKVTGNPTEHSKEKPKSHWGEELSDCPPRTEGEKRFDEDRTGENRGGTELRQGQEDLMEPKGNRVKSGPVVGGGSGVGKRS